MQPIMESPRPSLQACRACGQPLGAEPQLMLSMPVACHLRCVDWSGRPFFFARHLAALRALHRLHPDVRALVSPVGRRLAEMERAWPVGAQQVCTVLDELRGTVTALRDAGVDRRTLRAL